jgi:hypothetical protein
MLKPVAPHKEMQRQRVSTINLFNLFKKIPTSPAREVRYVAMAKTTGQN